MDEGIGLTFAYGGVRNTFKKKTISAAARKNRKRHHDNQIARITIFFFKNRNFHAAHCRPLRH